MSRVFERDVLLEPWFSIEIAGEEMGEDMLKYVSEVQVEDIKDKLSLARISIEDVDSKWLTGKAVGKNSTLVIKMGHRKENKASFRGEITHIEPNFQVDGYPTLVIYGIDTAVKMMKNRVTKVHKKKKVSDVVNEILRNGGFEADVKDTQVVLDHIQQNKETDLEFITRWAKKLGWHFFKTPSGKYYFGPKNKEDFPIETLGYKVGGMELISFSPTFTEIETKDDKQEKQIDNKKGKETKSKRK